MQLRAHLADRNSGPSGNNDSWYLSVDCARLKEESSSYVAGSGETQRWMGRGRLLAFELTSWLPVRESSAAHAPPCLWFTRFIFRKYFQTRKIFQFIFSRPESFRSTKRQVSVNVHLSSILMFLKPKNDWKKGINNTRMFFLKEVRYVSYTIGCDLILNYEGFNNMYLTFKLPWIIKLYFLIKVVIEFGKVRV